MYPVTIMIVVLLSLSLSLALSLSLSLAAVDGSSEEDTDYSLEVIFPEQEFNRFSDCLYFGDRNSAVCTAFFTVGEFNITVDGVDETWSEAKKQEPCKYFRCDSNFTVPEGELVCHQQDTSTVCNTRLEHQFMPEPVKIRRGSTCVVLFLSETVDTFNFEGQGNFESCSSSCLCETLAATTPASVSVMDTTTERSSSANTSYTTVETTTTFSTNSIKDETVANVTVVVTTGVTVSSTEHSTDNMNSSSTTMATPIFISDSSVKQTEATRSSDNLLGKDTNIKDTAPNSTTIIVPVVVGVVAAAIVLGLYLYVRWRKVQVQQIIEDHELESGHSRPTGNTRRQGSRDTGHNSDTEVRLVSEGDEAETEMT